MTSKFGIVARKIRSKNNESLRKMATRLEISPSFLSAMEVGRKLVPNDYAKKIKDTYNLNDDEYKELYESIIETNKRVDIEIEKMNEAQKEVSMTFARKIENADPDLVEKLRKVLMDSDDKN